jgi:hypothetical protein
MKKIDRHGDSAVRAVAGAIRSRVGEPSRPVAVSGTVHTDLLLAGGTWKPAGIPAGAIEIEVPVPEDLSERHRATRLTVTAAAFARDVTVAADRVGPEPAGDDMLADLLAGDDQTYTARTGADVDPAAFAAPKALWSAGALTALDRSR